MRIAITLCIVIVGLINFFPVLGVLSASNLETAYGLALLEDDVILLLRHRALLFGLLGGYVLYSAWQISHRVVALVLAGISMIGFALLMHGAATTNEALQRVLLVDYLGIFFLLVAAVLMVCHARRLSSQP